MIWKIASWVVGVLALAAGVEWMTSRSLVQKFPPPGEMITVNGTDRHIWCEGHQGPVVVFVAGAGGLSAQWSDLVERLSEEFLVCAYDRPGLGWSPASPAPRDLPNIAEELRATLHAAGRDQSITLVGHSFGGLVAQYYARANPGRVSGLVLIDSISADYFDGLPESALKARRGQIRMLDVSSWFAQVGLLRWLNLVQLPPEFPGDYADAAKAMSVRAETLRTMARETRAFHAGVEVLNALPPLPDDIPVSVVSRQVDLSGDDQLESHWHRVQSRLARLTAQTRHYPSASVHHDLHLTDTDLVEQVVRDTVEVGG